MPCVLAMPVDVARANATDDTRADIVQVVAKAAITTVAWNQKTGKISQYQHQVTEM